MRERARLLEEPPPTPGPTWVDVRAQVPFSLGSGRAARSGRLSVMCTGSATFGKLAGCIPGTKLT